MRRLIAAHNADRLLVLRCLVFIGVCVEFVAAVAWLAELFPERERRERVLAYTQAFSSIGGIMVATVLTILVLPAAYALFFRVKPAVAQAEAPAALAPPAEEVELQPAEIYAIAAE